MKNLKKLLLPSLAIAAMLSAGTVAKADSLPLSLNLDSAFQNAYAGTVVTFDVTVTDVNGVDTINLDGDSFSLDSPLTLDDSGFWNNSPFFLNPGQSSSDFELFSVFIPAGTADGLYTGTFEITGEPDQNDAGIVGEATFNVNVVPTPEPSSLLLLGSGMLALAGAARRRFSR